MSWMKHYARKFEAFKVILKKRDPVIVEIGAHFGEDSVRFSEAFPEGKIYCFEPDPRCITVFKKYVKNDRIKLFEVALSDSNGVANFFQSYDDTKSDFVPDKYDWIDLEDYKNNKLSNSGSSSLKEGYRNNLDKISVNTQRFDSWYAENSPGNIDLAWIDVQGAEKEVLKGFGDTISLVSHIWIEYGEKEYTGAMSRNETIKFLGEKGFDLLNMFSTPSFAPQGDLLFKRREQ